MIGKYESNICISEIICTYILLEPIALIIIYTLMINTYLLIIYKYNNLKGVKCIIYIHIIFTIIICT